MRDHPHCIGPVTRLALLITAIGLSAAKCALVRLPEATETGCTATTGVAAAPAVLAWTDAVCGALVPVVQSGVTAERDRPPRAVDATRCIAAGGGRVRCDLGAAARDYAAARARWQPRLRALADAMLQEEWDGPTVRRDRNR